ncbi:Histidine kinase-, DNA gyrase B-, and HSP90-like ATPase [compost metagenome]
MIENALEHAWFGSSLGIRLVVVKRDSEVVFKVIDNGIGMSPDTITRILDPEGPRIGYGIRNVDSRVRLHYGESYGIRMASRPGIGTCVEIVVPCRS